MRIGCLQFAPQVGDIDNNLNRADSVLSKADIDDLDLLVLPELAFSGYNFKSLQHISPYLEPSGSGITSLWARTTALKYNCNVVVGYPEKVDVSTQWPTGPEYYNSAIVVNGDGETIANYRKSFLYYTDETWALEGNNGFYEGWIPGLGNASIGICMDLNPYKFQAPWHAFEFAFHVLENESNLVIVSMAWMTREDGRMFSRMPNEPDMDTLTYWVTRLEPLIRSENEDEIIVVFCNRTGTEDDVVYAGTSAVVGVHDGEVKIYGLLGRGEKELLVVDTSNPPYAKLVYRPESDRPSAVHSELQRTDSSPSSNNASLTGPSNLGSSARQGFSSHTPTQPTSPPTKPSSASANTQKPATRHAKVPPNIQIPPLATSTSYTFLEAAANSPGADSINLPTPTAPSPTPMAMRPKLIIPQSPPLAPWQSASPIPQSGQSVQSMHSVQSVQSVNSIRSISTVTSNPRPPEDSTPYPHSGAPLSGYPTRNSDKRIYGGSVSISQLPFSPITPFDDQSPLESRYFWRPSDSFLKTPMVSKPRDSKPRSAIAEPDDTRTQSFAFPLFHEPAPRTHSSNSLRTVATTGTARKDGDNAVRDKKRAPSQNPKARASSKSRTRNNVVAVRNEPATGPSSRDALPHRPSSPKSRNASRSRTHERSDSSLANPDHSNAITQQLEFIAQRAESVNRNRNTHGEGGTPQPDRPSSPKSRNCSRSRPSEDRSSILIGASPSLLSDEHSPPLATDTQKAQSPPQRPMSSMGFRARAGSATGFRPPSRNSVNGVVARPRPASRAASRGRQPGPNFSPPKMSPQDPSLPREPASDEIVRIERDRKQSIGSKPPVESPAPEPNYDRVESVLCPTCPVHGRHSTSSAPVAHSASPGPRASPDLISGRSMSSPAAVAVVGSIDAVSTHAIGSDPQYSAAGSMKPTSDVSSLTETVETISTASRSPSTPFFEPRTPKAMVIIRDTDVQGNDNGPLIPGLPDSLSELTCVDRAANQIAGKPQVILI